MTDDERKEFIEEIRRIRVRLTENEPPKVRPFDINGYTATFSFCTREEKERLYRVLHNAWMWGARTVLRPRETKSILKKDY